MMRRSSRNWDAKALKKESEARSANAGAMRSVATASVPAAEAPAANDISCPYGAGTAIAGGGTHSTRGRRRGAGHAGCARPAQARYDEESIGRACIQKGILPITTLSAAHAFLKAIHHNDESINIKSIQEYNN